MAQFGNMKGGGMGKFSFFPPVIKFLIISNAVIFVVQYLLLSGLTIGGTNLSMLIMKYLALQPMDGSLLSFSGGGFYPWQLLSYQFLHGGFFHLFFNLFALWMFGVEMENRWGSSKFLTYYLLSGIGAGIVHMVVSPFIGGMGPTVGASGAIYGILVAFGLTFPNRPIFMIPFFIPIPAKYFVMIFAAFEMFSGLTGGDGIAHFAHIGGGLTGFLLLKFGDQAGIFKWFDKLYGSLFSSGSKTRTSFGSSGSYGNRGSEYDSSYSSSYSKPKSYYVKWEKPKREEKKKEAYEEDNSKKIINIDGEPVTQNRIDEILDKISASGYQSLTDREKYILTELSKRL